MHTHTCIHAHMHTQYIHTYTHLHTHMCTKTCIYAYTCTLTCIQRHACMYACTCMHTHSLTSTHTYPQPYRLSKHKVNCLQVPGPIFECCLGKSRVSLRKSFSASLWCNQPEWHLYLDQPVTDRTLEHLLNFKGQKLKNDFFLFSRAPESQVQMMELLQG